MFVYWKGMKSLEKAAFSSTYETIWIAGPSIEHTTEIESMRDIVRRFTHQPQ
jgi:nitronate monooxygenase